MNKIIRFICDKGYRYGVYLRYGLFNHLSDEAFLKLRYESKMGEKLDLENPRTFNAKLQWLKLYNRHPEHTQMVDKYGVKQLVAEQIGERYIIPTLGVWERFEDIDFDALPDQFVLKCTHDSGGLVICRDKASLDLEKAKRKLNASLKRNFYLRCREWPYKNVKPQILAEVYMQDGQNLSLPVYKIFNFDGEPKIIQSIQNDKTKQASIDYFDTEWNLLDMRQNFPNSQKPLERPEGLSEMLELARKLSKGFPFLRTDFYVINGRIYFSEYTFFSDAGWQKFHPEQWDKQLGDWIQLPAEKSIRE